MKINKLTLPLVSVLLGGALVGCSNSTTSAEQPESFEKIIRIGHNQSQNHPTHIGMLAFEEHIEESTNGQYDVQIFPNELLGTQTNMVQLTQTGAIEMTVASNSILETFDSRFQIFNLPYLFESPEIYHEVMNDQEIVGPLFNGTAESGFTVEAWLDAGTRNFYLADHAVETPEDLSGQKVRVQQSPTNVRMIELFGGSATPMGFGDVYTAIQSGVLDGAENNELALTENGHGDVVNYYSYTHHQMIPDLVIVNHNFIENLDQNIKAIFDEGFEIMQNAQHDAWAESVEEAKDHAQNVQGVEFNYPDIMPFRDSQLQLHEEILKNNPELNTIYNQVQERNEANENGGNTNDNEN